MKRELFLILTLERDFLVESFFFFQSTKFKTTVLRGVKLVGRTAEPPRMTVRSRFRAMVKVAAPPGRRVMKPMQGISTPMSKRRSMRRELTGPDEVIVPVMANPRRDPVKRP